MGCGQSSPNHQNASSPSKLTKNINYHQAYTFQTTKQLKANIIITQNVNIRPLHIALQQLVQKKPSNFIKGFFSNNTNAKNQFAITVQSGTYKIHVITNWETSQGKYDIKLSDQSVNLKPSNDRNQGFYNCIAQQSRSKGKGVKQQQFYSCLYHQPQSNLIVVMAMNQGDSMTYNLDLSECKQKQKYKIINPIQEKQSSQWTRSCTINKNCLKTWIIAPIVAYDAGNLFKWEIKQAILGQAKECMMMQIGGGFDQLSNPPPDSL